MLTRPSCPSLFQTRAGASERACEWDQYRSTLLHQLQIVIISFLFIYLFFWPELASQPDDEETRKECCQISWKNDDGRKKGEEEEEMWKDRKRELFFKCWNKRLLIGPKQTNRQTHRPVDHGTKKKGENRDRSSRERITHQSVLRLPELRRRRRRKRSIYPAGLLVCFASSGIFFICIKRIDVCGRKKNMPFFHLLGDF